MVLLSRGLLSNWICRVEDGINFTRLDEAAGIEPSDHGWDRDMQGYPHIFDYDDRRYMIYNGNNFGQTGLGLALLER